MTRQIKRERRRGRYSPTLKRRIAKSYLAGEASYAMLATENGLDNKGVVKEFVKWYRRQESAEPSNSAAMSDKKSNKNGDSKSLQQENEELRRQLRAAELKAEAFETMIDLAESQFKIAIRKKSGAKPSKA